MRNATAHRLNAIAIGLLCIAGCSGQVTVPVEGVVTLQGTPLANADVMLAPRRANGPGPYVGKTGSDGRFQLGLQNQPGSGAAVGDYSVFISTVKSDPGEEPPAVRQKEIVPLRFRNGSEQFSVPEGGTSTVEFALQ
jgi:hypothetical protein